MTALDPDPLVPPDFQAEAEAALAEYRLRRLREQRRQRRLGCSIVPFLLAALFWAAVAWAGVQVFAAPSGAPVGSASLDLSPESPALRGAPPTFSPPATVVITEARGAPTLAGGTTYTGLASWFPAAGMQGAVPWWRPGQDPQWASVCRFTGGRSRCVTVLLTGWCGCLQGQSGERLIDLSPAAFRQLAPLSVGLIRVTLEVPVQGPRLPQTDTGGE